MSARFRLKAAATILCLTSTVLADAPTVTSLFPRGATVGSNVEVTVSGKLSQPGTAAWCSNPAVKVVIPESGDKATIEVPSDAAPGLAWIRFHNADGATGPLPFVIGRLPEINETEPNNELQKAQSIDGPVVVNGKLASNGDVDVTAVSLKKDQTLIAAVEANWRLGSPVDMVVQIVSASGAVVGQVDDDRGFDPLIAFTAPADGTWYVRTFGFPATPNSSIRFSGGAEYAYRLTLTTGPFVNHSVPAAVSHESDDTVRLVGWNLPEELQQPVTPQLEPVFQLAHPLLPQPVDIELVSGPVAVAAEPCDRSSPLVVESGTTVCGVIDKADDEDSIRFPATKGQKLMFRVESRALGHPLDPVLRVYDSAGALVTESDDTTRDVFDPALKFTAKADGEYTVSIRDRFNHGGWRYAWRMHVEDLKPSVGLTVKADRFVLPADKPLEIPVTIARNDGFNEEIVVGVTGLPDGITADPVKSEAKGDSAKSVTLKVTRSGDAKPFNGPVEISTTTATGEAVKATAALTTFRTTTDQIWLTVVPKPDEDPKSE